MTTHPGADVAPHHLLGRDAEIGRLDAWLHAALTRGAALRIVGEVGTGKTALFDVAAARAARAGAIVLALAGARCGERVALAAVDQLFTPVRQQLWTQPADGVAPLLRALGMRDGPPATELEVCVATVTLLRRLSRDQPVVIVIDDAHLMDTASATVLSFAARRLAGSPIGVLMTARTGSSLTIERSEPDVLELSNLDDGSAAGLLAARFPALRTRVRERIIAEAGGNPLALTALPALFTQAQREGRAGLPMILPTGRRVTAMFSDRIAALSARGREALLLAALTDGERISDESAGAVRPALGSLDLAGPLHEAVAAGLLVLDRSDGRIIFGQPLVRSAVVQMSTQLERRRAHRLLASAAPPGSLRWVWHQAQASVTPDEGLAAALEGVARTSLGDGAVGVAVRVLSQAADLSPDPGRRRRRLAAAAYIGADVTGDVDRALGLLADAGAEPVDRTEGSPAALSISTARAYVMVIGDGDVLAAHELLVEAIAAALAGGAAEGPDARADLADALHTLMLVCFFAGAQELWAPFYAAVDALGARVPRILSLCADTLCDPVHRGVARLPELDAHLAQLYLEVDPTSVVRSAMASIYVDRSPACREALARVAADGSAGGAVASGIAAGVELGFDAVASGDWSAATGYFRDAVVACERHGYALLAWPARFGQALLAAARGDYQTVEAMATAMVEWAEPRSVLQVCRYARHVRALAALGAGDPAAAFEHATAIAAPGQFPPSTAHAVWVMLDTVESAEASGRHGDAVAHVRAMRAASVASLSPRYAMVTATAAALIARGADATAGFEAALSVPGADRWPFDRARTQLLFGEHLRHQRDVEGARGHLRAALDVFTWLGAEPWRVRAATQLRGSGEARTVTLTDHRTIELTPYQARVATLAATGLTNKQIASQCRTSHRGVGSVLSRVFRELNITSRAALSDALSSCDIRTAG